MYYQITVDDAMVAIAVDINIAIIIGKRLSQRFRKVLVVDSDCRIVYYCE